MLRNAEHRSRVNNGSGNSRRNSLIRPAISWALVDASNVKFRLRFTCSFSWTEAKNRFDISILSDLTSFKRFFDTPTRNKPTVCNARKAKKKVRQDRNDGRSYHSSPSNHSSSGLIPVLSLDSIARCCIDWRPLLVRCLPVLRARPIGSSIVRNQCRISEDQWRISAMSPKHSSAYM